MEKIKNYIIGSILCFAFAVCVDGQESVFQTFKDTRVVNAHSVETIKGGRMDFRVAHRFGDLAGSGGGWSTFYGLENASDVMIGFEFGLSDKLMFGVNRTKGSGPLKQNVNTFLKYRLITQQDGGNQPFSLAVLGMSSASTMPKSSVEGVLNFFAKTAHRFTYHLQMILAKKFSDRFSLQFSGAWTYRNIVPANDQNDLVSLGGAMRLQASKTLALLIDATLPFSEIRTSDNGYYPGLGFGLEWETGGGHVFMMNVTNTRGLVETDFIPYSRSNWLDGEFRIGFTISRLFTL